MDGVPAIGSAHCLHTAYGRGRLAKSAATLFHVFRKYYLHFLLSIFFFFEIWQRNMADHHARIAFCLLASLVLLTLGDGLDEVVGVGTPRRQAFNPVVVSTSLGAAQSPMATTKRQKHFSAKVPLTNYYQSRSSLM